MATQVLIAHTGQRLPVDTPQLNSLDDFKALVSRQSSIPAQYLVALTPQGKSPKLQLLQTEEIICIYDIRITQATSPGAAAPAKNDIPLPKRYAISNPPNQIDDTRSVHSWQELFKNRRTWALKLAEDCAQMANTAQERYDEMDAILRCIDAAIANLESVIRGTEPKYLELKKWMGPAQKEYNVLTTNWEQYLSLARTINISPAMAYFMTGRDITRGQATLEDLVDLDTARKSGRLAPQSLRKFAVKATDLEKAYTRMSSRFEELNREFEQTLGRSATSHKTDSAQLLEDIEAVTRKIDTDYQTTLEYSDSTRDVLQASKIAATHTERLLPSLKNRVAEMDEMLRYATQARNDIALESVEYLRIISDVTGLTSGVKSQITVLNQAEEDMTTFDYLRLIQQVPYMYASFVAESVRRREWSDKVKTDSSTLANEMALFREEEVKRRRRFHKLVSNAYGPEDPSGDNTVAGMEVNILGDEEKWPEMARQDLDELMEALQQQRADPNVVNDISKIVTELNNPTKQQTKRLKAFKNGSIHENALGRSGLLIRGDDGLLRDLQDEKQRLEGKLRTAESRVRRLEDLLHRQGQASRPSIGNLFQLPSQQFTERPDSAASMRSPGFEHRRIASDGGPDKLLQRINQLESELHAEKERSAIFEKDLNTKTTEKTDMEGQMEEVNSTKKDLLENMEALKREFMEERKSLEDEIRSLKTRLEDTEDEIEHFDESREHEKASYDEKVHTLELEIERLNKERDDEVLKIQGQIDFLRKESRLQREQNETMEKDLQSAKDESKKLSRDLDGAHDAAESQLNALRELHRQLAPNAPVPADLHDLVEAVSSRAADVVAKAQDVEGDMSLLQSDLEHMQSTAKDLTAEIATTKDKLSSQEETSLHLRENLAEEKARASALERELAEAREHLSALRGRLSDGETGSESLRKQLEDEEKKSSKIAEELASRQSQVGSLEEELHLYKERMEDSQTKLTNLNGRFEARAEKAKDLTQRLYSQNDRLCRLLERLGFSITRQGSSISIQKVPRSERISTSANANDSSDPGSSVRRSGLLASKAMADSADLELLYWTNSGDAETETQKYEAFMTALGSFDMDAFSETVYRRVKDVEHMARKLQRDARAYREKAHNFQKDAHEKIAFKNFKEGDLALFLPTRNQSTGAWAAFNVGFPHYFLRETETHRLRSREWLVARISRIQERVVDLSRTMQHSTTTGGTGGSSTNAVAAETDSLNDEENDNPFDLSDGLRWYLIDAHEDKPGAPATPGLGKSTVAANTVEAMAEPRNLLKDKARQQVGGGIEGVSKTLSKSLESRRSSTGSRKALPFAIGGGGGAAGSRNSALASETNSLRAGHDGTHSRTSSTSAQAQGPPPPVPPKEPLEPPKTQEHGEGSGGGASEAESSRQPQEGVQQPTPEGLRHRRHGSSSLSPSKLRPDLQRGQSNASVESPSKRSVVWDSLWSYDVSYEGGGKQAQKQRSS